MASDVWEPWKITQKKSFMNLWYLHMNLWYLQIVNDFNPVAIRMPILEMALLRIAFKAHYLIIWHEFCQWHVDVWLAASKITSEPCHWNHATSAQETFVSKFSIPFRTILINLYQCIEMVGHWKCLVVSWVGSWPNGPEYNACYWSVAKEAT